MTGGGLVLWGKESPHSLRGSWTTLRGSQVAVTPGWRAGQGWAGRRRSGWLHAGLWGACCLGKREHTRAGRTGASLPWTVPCRGSDPEAGVARGIDFHHVCAVLNFDLPPSPEAYIHRAGR